MSGAPALQPAAVALSAIRPLPSGSFHQYTAATFPQNPWQGCEHMIRMARACGFVTTCSGVCDCYAVLDVLDDDGDVIQDFCITTPRAFRWFYRKLHWRIEGR